RNDIRFYDEAVKPFNPYTAALTQAGILFLWDSARRQQPFPGPGSESAKTPICLFPIRQEGLENHGRPGQGHTCAARSGVSVSRCHPIGSYGGEPVGLASSRAPPRNPQVWKRLDFASIRNPSTFLCRPPARSFA